MSVSAIMKNILTFAEILSQSSGRHAQHWDSHSLQNALKWATYVQQICEHMSSKGCLAELEEQVRGLLIYLRPPTCMDLSVNTLTNATQVLRSNLLQNPFISEALFEELLHLYDSSDSLLQDCSDIACSRASSEVIQGLCVALQPEEQHSPRNNGAVCQGEQLLQKLVKQKSLHVNRESRFVEYVSVLLKQLVWEDRGWDVVLGLLHSDIEHGVTEAEGIKQIVIDWIVQSKIEFSHRCDRTLGCGVSQLNSQMCECYLDQLVAWGNGMEVRYSQPGEQPLYTWRWKGDISGSRSYDHLVRRWAGLVSQSRTENRARERLTQMAFRDQPNIWRDITKHIHPSKGNET